ncbi:MAG: aminomethyl-transferring glycine dehydrogenase subunit GcvPB [Candidatus Ratteibacteria bacterium]|jgi:glycine dehydrogenase subunit 2
MRLIFEKGKTGRQGIRIAKHDVPIQCELPVSLQRKEPAALPGVSELDVVRHFSRLAGRNFSVDTHFYPLGSCTMKYNPKCTETIASLDGFQQVHPLLPQLSGGGILTQGCLELLHETEQWLCEITGMDAYTMQPLAGAHGELTGAMLIAAYHRNRGNRRRYIIVPDSSHGTNPASAAIAGYEVVVIPSDETGDMNIAKYREALSDEVAGVMLTCPNTLGIFNPRIREICDLGHQAGALMYYDGANLNAIMGKVRPGDLGFDIVHLNLHKTFATPHGGGGPGAGPVGVKKELSDLLPISRVVRRSDGTYALDYNYPKSIGYIAPFYGNFLPVVKAYAYMLLLGKEGLARVSEIAVLNANYVKEALKKYFSLPFEEGCMHEVVFSAEQQKKYGVTALDIAKYLIEQGIHPPTVYFPLIVKEALMVEPTETESKETLDIFIESMIMAATLAKEDPSCLHEAPQGAPVRRPDEVRAARELDTAWIKK